MPTTVTSSAGVSYHLWQLPDLTTPEPEDSIEFLTLDNDLSDGYRSTVLFGSNTGTRRWKLKFPTLASAEVLSNTVTDINGASVSREQYVRSLFAENKVTGEPFAYADPATGQYYLVDFEDKELSLERMRVKIYSTGLVLKQRRLTGVTVFVPSVRYGNTDAAYPTFWLKGSGYDDGTESWTDAGAGSWVITGTGDVNEISAAQNGHNIVRFSNTTNDGVVTVVGGPTFKEAFIVMKMREVSFSNAAGIITGDGVAEPQVLIGSSGTTKFADLSLTGYEYRLNGTEYAASNQQAPMNEWGLVHLRYPTGWDLSGGMQIGKNRTTAGTFAELDLGEVIFTTSLLSLEVSRLITEHLIVKWAITA